MSIEPYVSWWTSLVKRYLTARDNFQTQNTELWMDIVNLEHRQECGHQHAVGFTWGTDTSVAVTNRLLDLPGAQARLWLSPTCFVSWGKALCCQCFQRSTLPRSSHLLFLLSFQQSSPLSYWLKGECCVERGSSSVYIGHERHVHVRF